MQQTISISLLPGLSAQVWTKEGIEYLHAKGVSARAIQALPKTKLAQEYFDNFILKPISQIDIFEAKK